MSVRPRRAARLSVLPLLCLCVLCLPAADAGLLELPDLSVWNSCGSKNNY